jgi:hypothetical protein
MTKDEALILVLDALENHIEDSRCDNLIEKLITAIKAALEAKDEPEQMAKLGWQVIDCPICGGGARAFPKQEAKDEPVAWWIPKHKAPDMVSKVRWSDECEPLYTTPPQRKPLTDEEITLIIADCASSHQHTDIHLARAIEQAHGITGENK